jgi:hypothetical protein
MMVGNKQIVLVSNVIRSFETDPSTQQCIQRVIDLPQNHVMVRTVPVELTSIKHVMR